MLNKIFLKIALFCLNKVNKIRYWQYETLSGNVITLSVRKGKIFILKDDYYILKNDLQGNLLLKDFENNKVEIEVLD